jgi:hypothetical protein
MSVYSLVVVFDRERLHLVSMSPTFQVSLFGAKNSRDDFLYLHFRFELFWQKNIGRKFAHKMLLKFTTGDVSHLPVKKALQFC